MRFNFKRIASVLTSAVLLSSTMALAATTSQFPAPFVKSGVADVAVVYGSAAAVAPTDVVKAQQISLKLGDYQVAQVSTPVATPGTTTITGESKAVETSTKLYLGDLMNNTKSSFTQTELPTVLANGKVSDNDGTEYTYEQRIEVPTTKVLYGETSDNLATPIIYTDFDGTGKDYVLRVIFPSAVNVTKLTDKSIRLFGKDYTFSGSASQLTTSTITLFEKSQAVKINDGESKDVNGHTISVAVEDADTASISVDGVSESKDEGWSGKINGVDLYVKNVVGPNVAGTSRFVELYLNSNKLVLEQGANVRLGSSDISGTIVNISSSSATKVNEIRVTVSPRSFATSKKYIPLGGELVDPVFGSVKFSLASVTPPLNDSSRDEIVIRPSGENRASIKFTNFAGTVYEEDLIVNSGNELNETFLPLKNTTGSSMGALTYYATKLGHGDYNVTTVSTQSTVANDYFITCSNEYTQIWKITSFSPATTSSNIKIKLDDLGVGATDPEALTFSSNAAGGTATLSLGGGGSAVITLSNNASGSENVTISNTCDYLYTKNGAKIDLAKANARVNDVNSSYISISEETNYNGGVFQDNAQATLGKYVNVSLRYYSSTRTGKDMTVYSATPDGTSSTHYWYDDVGDYDQYTLTKYGTFMKKTGDTDKTVSIYYPKDAMNIGFYIGEVASSISSGGDDSGSGKVGSVLFLKDNEVSKFQDKNLIVVGGSCINTVAAKLLGSNTPLCSEQFTAVTGIGAGKYLVKTFASPFANASAGKVATLVAGYEAKETENAADFLLSQNVSTAVGDEYVTGVKTTVGATA